MFGNYMVGIILFIVVSFILYVIAACYIYRNSHSSGRNYKKSPPKQKDKPGM